MPSDRTRRSAFRLLHDAEKVRDEHDGRTDRGVFANLESSLGQDDEREQRLLDDVQEQVHLISPLFWQAHQRLNANQSDEAFAPRFAFNHISMLQRQQREMSSR